ncbi:MAG: UDP-N-acetylmuramate--L-alanine ligase [Leptonema sp. (in: bacteria)]
MKIHIVGIGGIAMGNFAKMLKDSGHEVSGSDSQLYPPMSLQLATWGFRVENFSKDNIINPNGEPKHDLYIVGNVISRGNVEVEVILNYNLPLMSMSEALYQFFLKNKKVIVIAGTHGKTTTTFLLHSILEKSGLDSGLFSGGIRLDGHAGFKIGKGDYFVIEGDEYDTSFFDKKPKFLHYRPYYLILTSIEYDHADIYKNMEEYINSFKLLLRWIPQQGKIVANYDDLNIRTILEKLENVIYYSSNTEQEKKENYKEIYKFSILDKSLILPVGKVVPKIFGMHNYSNILAASLLAQEIGIDSQSIIEAINEFPGVMRRQQLRKKIRFDEMSIEFYEDFAHHPTAVFETIKAFKNRFHNSLIIACYEPRSATSHRKIFQKEYPKSFLLAKAVYITEIYNPSKVEPEEQLNVKKLIEDIKIFNSKAFYCQTPKEVFEKLKKHFLDYCVIAKKNQYDTIIILCMSNGSFGNIYSDIENWMDRLASIDQH